MPVTFAEFTVSRFPVTCELLPPPVPPLDPDVDPLPPEHAARISERAPISTTGRTRA
jgi:hypothetical protein